MQLPRNVRLDLAYRGTPFHGLAENEGVRTVAGDLRAALERVDELRAQGPDST